MSEAREQLAIIRRVSYDMGDRGKPCLSFTAYIDEAGAALQVFSQPQADEIIKQANVEDIHKLDGRACWVRVEDGLIRFVRMADL